jgi:predicted Zn-dependent peptidase
MRALTICFAAVLITTHVTAEKASLPKDLPPYGPEIPPAVPHVKAEKLQNGLTVWLVSEPGFPKVSMTLVVKGGLAADPQDRPGLSELLATTIDQGTKARNAKQVAQELQGAGGDLKAEAQKDSIVVSTSFLSRKVGTGLAVFADVAQNAAFPTDEVALGKRNAIDELKQEESEPSFLASRAMAKALYGDHPYHVTAPTEKSLIASTPEELREIYAERFRPDQALLVAVGDFENDKMLAEVKERFGAWKVPAKAPLAAPAPVTTEPQHSITIVSRPDSVQTTLSLGMFGPLRNDADYEAADVANAIYGGTFGSRLVTNIREDKGYTYSPSARLRTYRAAGTLVTQADVRNEVTGPTLNEINYELNRLVTTSPTNDEMAQAERFLVGIEAIRLQLRGRVADELASLWVAGLTPEAIGDYGRKVMNTKANDVNAAARKYFPAARTTIVAVGEEKVVRDALSPFGIPMQVAK